jgi:hypothetical protein
MSSEPAQAKVMVRPYLKNQIKIEGLGQSVPKALHSVLSTQACLAWQADLLEADFLSFFFFFCKQEYTLK